MKNILFTAIFLALVSASAASAQQMEQTSQQKPTAQKSSEQKPAAQKSAAQAPATQPREPRPTNSMRASGRTRTITGRVVDEGNKPIEGASIFASPAGMNFVSERSRVSDRMHSASTNEQGEFALENVPPGAYRLSARAQGYVIAPDINEERGGEKYYRVGDTVSLRMIKGGVITGTVTNSTGEPVVAVRVRPILLRDLKNRTAPPNLYDMQREWRTDDRGVYRIYGLEPGVYLVYTGGKNFNQQHISPYDFDEPTFFPSASRVNASEVKVNSGEEASGIDIRYRDNRGHIISGSVTGAIADSDRNMAVVYISDAVTGTFVGVAEASMGPNGRGFAITTVSDGEYIAKAIGSGDGREITLSSPPRRVVVKGDDVAGVNLALAPFGSIAGRVALEPVEGAERKPQCKDRRESSIEGTVIRPRADEKGKPKDQQSMGKSFSLFGLPIEGTPNDKGEFKIEMLEAARYHLEMKLPSDDWYIRSVTLPADSPATKPQNAALNGIALKAGDHLAGMTVKIAEGAAGLRGRIVPATEGARLPDGLQVHLIPAEKEAAEDTLRFAEAAVQSDGLFTLGNLAPGKYLLLIKPAADKTSTDSEPRPVAWDGEGRAMLRKQGEAASIAIELQPCQRINDYVLRYAPEARLKPKSAESKQQ
jgi:protocatechuate 3,4-dioxygenase beta subunit